MPVTDLAPAYDSSVSVPTTASVHDDEPVEADVSDCAEAEDPYLF